MEGAIFRDISRPIGRVQQKTYLGISLVSVCRAEKRAVKWVCVCVTVYPMISRRRFQQMEVLEGLNILVTISGRKNKLRVYYLSWLKTKILKTEAVMQLVVVMCTCFF